MASWAADGHVHGHGDGNLIEDFSLDHHRFLDNDDLRRRLICRHGLCEGWRLWLRLWCPAALTMATMTAGLTPASLSIFSVSGSTGKTR